MTARRARRGLIGAAALVVAAAIVLAVEVQLARTGPDLPDDDPFVHDGRIGGAGTALTMLWLGDSTAAGLGATAADRALPRLVATALDRPIDVVNRAVSGARIADVRADQLPGVRAVDPDLVLISIGANDVTHLTARSTFESTYREVLEALPPSALVVVLGVPDMGAPPRLAQPLRASAGLRGRQLDEIARRTAAEAGALYVDIAGETGPTMRSDTERYFAADRYHPSDDGYLLWADAVVARLAPALADRRELVGADR